MSLSDLGWDRHLDVPLPDPCPPASRPARVVLQAPGVWRVHDGDRSCSPASAVAASRNRRSAATGCS